MDKSQHIELSIHNAGKGKYRFGINISDSAKYFKKRDCVVVLQIQSQIFITKTTCGLLVYSEPSALKFKKGFDLYSKGISEFIIENEWHIIKIERFFKITIQEEGIYLEYDS